MVLGPHHFLITELQLLKVSFFLSVSLRAETANLPVPLPSSLAALLAAAKIYGIDPGREGGGQIVTQGRLKSGVKLRTDK